jgi:molybdopterin/thiamine biosynthesis adenylyltransferase
MSAFPLEFSRNSGFLSAQEQERLQDSTVAVAGAGGDGGMLAIQLARIGVGSIRLADPETFDLENINRQARATHETIGMNKAQVIGEYLMEINPAIEVQVYAEGVTPDNTAEFVKGADLLIDETEYTEHQLGIGLAREARETGIPNLMALNIGFGATVTTYHPEGRSLERTLGLDEDMSLDEVAKQEVDLTKWLAYLPPYVDIDVFKAVARSEVPAPSVAPGVNLASALGSTQAFLNLVRNIKNNRPNPVYAPKVIMMDAMTGKSKVINYPWISTRIYMARVAFNNVTRRVPKAD